MEIKNDLSESIKIDQSNDFSKQITNRFAKEDITIIIYDWESILIDINPKEVNNICTNLSTEQNEESKQRCSYQILTT